MQVFLRKFEALMGYEFKLNFRVWAFCLGLLLVGAVFAVVQNFNLLREIHRIHILGYNVFSVAHNIPKDAGRFEGHSGFSGTGIEKERYLLLSRYDGDEQESVVELVDLRDFTVAHIWNPDFNAIRKGIRAQGYKGDVKVLNEGRGRFRHPLLTRDLSLVFQMANHLIELDSEAKFISRLEVSRIHHSIEEDGQGNLWVASRFCPSSLPTKWVGRGCGWSVDQKNYLDDGILQLSPGGEVLFAKSVSEILIENGMIHLLFGVKSYDYDPIHLNDIQPVLEDGPFWKRGDVFLSLRNQSMIMLYRPSNNKLLWVDSGKTLYQHDVDILDESRISIFDNNNLIVKTGNKGNGPNRMVIYDFATGQYSTHLEEAMAREEMRALGEGRGQILPDGDLWVEETVYGRFLYFKAEGALKWRYVNRASNGNLYRVDWARILYQPQDIERVHRLLNQTGPKAS